MNQKAKEPLMGMLLSVVLPGLGQMYAGRLIRGIIALVLTILPTLGLLFYFLQPAVKISRHWYIPFFLPLVLYFVAVVDSYIQVRKYNLAHKLSSDTRLVRIIIYIVGILSCCVIVNPVYLGKVFIENNLIRSFTAPPDSMAAAIYTGERVFVDLKRYKKSGPQRGDVFVYRPPEKPGEVFMHRIVGLPGESVELKEHAILINGAKIKESWNMRNRYYNRGKFGKKGSPVTVPQDAYYVLGDYSAGSNDSRFWGFVPKGNLIGRVIKIYYPFTRSGAVNGAASIL
ncbi:MAG: signal peptidase I [Candidatus Omnitrophota bacterium]|jgi:signal peptidase I